MATDNLAQISPLKRNGVHAYLQRYLNTVTDWQTYREASDGDGFSQKVHDVTQTFFGSQKLKGLSLLLTAHILQQVSASLVSIIIRTWLHGDQIERYRGILVRQSQAAAWWQAQMPARLQARVQMLDSYYFHEAGRTWHCHTVEVAFSAEIAKTLTILTLLSLPNRVFYFDRAVVHTEAIDLAIGVKDADSIPGFIGDLGELDTLLPLIRLLKMGLYGLNWYLVDEDERDNRGPDVAGYNDLGYPSGPGHSGASYPYTPSGGSPAYRNPYPPNHHPPQSGYGQPNGLPYALATLAQRPTNIPEVSLVRAPIRLKLSIPR